MTWSTNGTEVNEENMVAFAPQMIATCQLLFELNLQALRPHSCKDLHGSPESSSSNCKVVIKADKRISPPFCADILT